MIRYDLVVISHLGKPGEDLGLDTHYGLCIRQESTVSLHRNDRKALEKKKLDWRDWHAFIEPWEGSQLVFVSGQLLICQRLGIGNS